MSNIIGALIIALAVLGAGAGISTTLDEVCPTVEGGTEFLSASLG
jgi:hypothetical protein